MHKLRWGLRAGRALLLLGLLAGLLAACDSNPPPPPTPVASTPVAATTAPAPPTEVPVPPTPTELAIIIGPALRPGSPITFQAALDKAWPAARQWNADALLVIGSLATTPATAGAGSWYFTFARADGKEQRLVLVSSTDLQSQSAPGVLDARILAGVRQNAAGVAGVLDSPALLDKVTALGYTLADQDKVSMVYYVTGENINITSNPHPLVQVRLSKGEASTQLVLDATDGSLLQKVENSGG